MPSHVPHIILLFYFLCAFPGAAVAGFSIYFCSRFPNKGWIYYSILTSSLFLLFFSEILDIYGSITGLPWILPDSLFSILFYRFLLQIIWIFFPLFLFELFQRVIPSVLLIFLFLTSSFFPLSIISSINQIFPWVSSAGEILFYSAIGLWCVQAYLWQKNLKMDILKKSLPVLAGLILVFLPLAFVDLQGLTGIGNEISLPLFLFYTLWNSYQLYMVKKWFTRKKGEGLNESIQSFCTQFDISRREKEIIVFIIRGMTNKEIAYEMGISEKTVKNHIYSIFQKSGIQNRMLLLIRIQSLG